MNTPRIAIVLPPREEYSARYKGAVALCMADFTRHSRYQNDTTLIGHMDSDFGTLHYHRLMNWKKWYFRDSYAYAYACAQWIRKQHFTHVEVQNRSLIFRYLKRLLPKDIALSLHLHNDAQTMAGTVTAAQRNTTLRDAAAIYCVSEFIRQRFLEACSAAHHHKTHTIHNGIDTTLYQPLPKTRTILYVGRIIQQKGALLLAEALSIIAPQHPDWHFVVCGVDRFEAQSDYERATHAFLAQLGPRCHYTGYVDHAQIMQQFAQAALAVIPSVWQEPFGRTVLEAMTGGAAIITSGFGGLAEVIGDAGQLVQPLTAQGLATAIELLLNNNDILLEKQHQARERAVALFDIRKVAAQLDDARASLLLS